MAEYIVVKIGKSNVGFQSEGVFVKMVKEMSAKMEVSPDVVVERALTDLYGRIMAHNEIYNPKVCKICGTIFDNYSGKMDICSPGCIGNMSTFAMFKNMVSILRKGGRR